MATAKKTSAKKSATKKTKQVTRKAPQKKSSSRKKSSNGEMKSFHVAKDTPPFSTFRVTRQTFYWVVLVTFIVFAQLWIINLQVEIASLLDIQQTQSSSY